MVSYANDTPLSKFIVSHERSIASYLLAMDAKMSDADIARCRATLIATFHTLYRHVNKCEPSCMELDLAMDIAFLREAFGS